tara:strand:+ start:6936 stop:7334 length:399 start_codon:yes stop_codon:yes gene_type:complete
MYSENEIFCLNRYHEEIILDYLSDIQMIIDMSTAEDDDYEAFLDVLTQIIMVHNNNGEDEYLDTIFRSEWLYSLPNMVYWAALGYLAVIPKDDDQINAIVTKLSKRLTKVNNRISNMILIHPFVDGDKTILN